MTYARRPIAIFILLAFGVSWLIALPLWLGGGITSPLLPVLGLAMMATPALAAIVVVFLVERPAQRAQALGLRPVGRVPRFLGFLALGLFVPVLLVLQALIVGTLLGLYTPDLVSFSGFRELLDQQLGGRRLPLPIGTLVALQLASVLVAAFINAIPALGEELGWRGWLLPQLLPLGTIPALLISGLIWGLWHAPLVLLGYNYPGVPGWLGVILMVGMCTVVGAIFGWLRIRSGSIWPAALAHGSFNASAGISLLFSATGRPVDTAQTTILGWTGWIVPALLVVVLVSTGRFRPVRQKTTGPGSSDPRPVEPVNGEPTRRP